MGFAKVPEKELDGIFPNCWAVTQREHHRSRMRRVDVGSGKRLVFRDLWTLEESQCQFLGACAFLSPTKGQEKVKSGQSFLFYTLKEFR